VVAEGVTGALVPASDPAAMAAALEPYLRSPETAAAHGRAGRERVQKLYNMAAMVAAYQSLYDRLCEQKKLFRKPVKSCVE
jgi:glycosyltransferase involved in cell wall biosynthesis